MSTSIQVLVGATPIFIEVEETESLEGPEEISAKDVVARVQEAFERAKQTIVHISSGMAQAIRALEHAAAPDEFTLEFGVKFKVDGTVLVASTGTEATLQVKMLYRNKAQ